MSSKCWVRSLRTSHCYHRRVHHGSGKCVHAVRNVCTMITEVRCLKTHVLKIRASFGVSDSSSPSCAFSFDGFWYEACSGVLHSACCGNSMSEERFALQRRPIFQLSKVHRQQSAFITCSVRCVFLLSPRCVLDVVHND